jgi:hypothetical protein
MLWKQRKVLSTYSVQQIMILLSDCRRMWVKDKVKMTFFVQEQVNVVEWCMGSCVHIFAMSKKIEA